MKQTNIACPGIKTTKDPKTGEYIKHYLLIDDEATTPTGNLICAQDGCKYLYRDRHMQDIWQNGFDLMSLPP